MSVEAIFISAPRRFEWFNFQGKATRTDGTTAENVKHLAFYVKKGCGPQNLIRSELRNERGSDLHLRSGGSNGSIFRVMRREFMELQLKT